MNVPVLATTVPAVIAPTAPGVMDSQNRVHHPYSPSTLGYLEACSAYKSKSSNHLDANSRALAGTLAHKVVEIGEDDNALSDEDAAAAAECLDFIEMRRKTFSEAPFEYRELYLPVDDCHFDDAEATTAGYADLILISKCGKYAELFDWKFGHWSVTGTQENLQAIAYVLGIFKKFPSVISVRVWFKQPHISKLDDHTFTRNQIPELYLRVQTVVARARIARVSDDYSTAVARAPVCNFCANIGKCPVVLKLALKVGTQFSPVEVPSDITPTKVHDPHNTKMALNLAAIVKVWADAFRRQVTDRVLRQEAEVPDHMILQAMPGRRRIVDMKKYKAICLKYVSEFEYEASLDSSFTPIERAILESAPRGNKKARVESFQKELEECGAVERGHGFAYLKVKSG